MTGVLALPFLPAIKSDLARWQAAAGRRDDVLVGVRDQASRLGCTTFVSEGEVDSVSGAYVFRHGLEEALARPDGGGVVPCRVSMTGGNLRIGPAR
jgi:hypothetical protein